MQIFKDTSQIGATIYRATAPCGVPCAHIVEVVQPEGQTFQAWKHGKLYNAPNADDFEIRVFKTEKGAERYIERGHSVRNV